MLTLTSPCKINLFLHVIGRRADGYHNLQTAFQILTFSDRVSIWENDTLAVEDLPGVKGEDNLVYRAALLLKQFALENSLGDGSMLGARIAIQKQIPMGAGLGGGSSNAATVMHGLNVLWRLGLSTSQLCALGLQLGADVPVFLKGYSAWGEGVGEKLEAIELPAKWFLVIKPNCEISTSEIFSNPELTRNTSPITIARFLEGESRNDCESIVRKLFPEVDDALSWLSSWGLARMTGTGSCVFVELDSKEQAEDIQVQVPSTWQSFVAEGVNKSPLLDELALA
jgi:4-diphosphocytidyl-2-C-methyl-D-erythritol kinase